MIIGAEAKLFENITVGNSVKIDGWAIITFDIPDNSVVKACKGVIVK